MAQWIDACAADDIESEEARRFDFGGRSFAIYRLEDDRYFATEGFCTHEKVHLADGFLMGTTIECPKHNGRFDVTTGQAKGAPVCINLKNFPVQVDNGRVMIDVS